MEREQKLRRLDKFRRSQPYITARALAAVLKDVAGNGIPELHGRDHMYQAAVELMNEVTPHGRLVTPTKLVKIDGGELETDVVNPLAFMYHAVKQGGAVSRNY